MIALYATQLVSLDSPSDHVYVAVSVTGVELKPQLGTHTPLARAYVEASLIVSYPLALVALLVVVVFCSSSATWK